MGQDNLRFKSQLRIKVTTEEVVQQWLAAFQRASCLTWRKSKIYPDAGLFNKYMVSPGLFDVESITKIMNKFGVQEPNCSMYSIILNPQEMKILY